SRHIKIDQWSERFDEVIRKIECILFARMKKAKRRQQSMRHQPARDGSPQHRVTIVKRSIDPALLSPMKLPAEQLGKIKRGGLPFDAAAVTRAYFLCQCFQALRTVNPHEPQAGSLIADLAAHYGGPSLLCERTRQIQLQTQPACSSRMREKRQEYPA